MYTWPEDALIYDLEDPIDYDESTSTIQTIKMSIRLRS